MNFPILPLGSNRTHFLVALLQAEFASRDVEQLLFFAPVRAVASQALAAGNRLVGIFSG
jgi:hypothetical protein